MGRAGAPGTRSYAAALVVLAAIGVPLALLTHLGLTASSSPGSATSVTPPTTLMPPIAPGEGAVASPDLPVVHRGIPLGPPKLPEDLYGGVFTGTKLAVTPASVVADLNDARARSMRVFVILVGAQRHYKRSEGTFDIDLWKSLVDEFRGIELDEFVEDGTIVAHQLISEAKARRQWGGTVIANNLLDEMARYSKEIWPTMPTVLRTDPSDLEEHAAAFGVPWPGWRWRYLDAASARYLVRKGSVEVFTAYERASARRQRLALVAGLNVFSGGDGSSGIESPRPGRWAMSQAELRRYGSTMLLRTTACAFELWRYETPGSAFEDFEYFRRPEISEAVAELAAIAARLPPRPCRRPGRR
ncbi:MAG TPA: hypothetical protein VFR38_04305 [Gaiellaceae bacterium]|nr:hypothetical protein [Gaiellaceae bacterium]